VTGKRRNMKGQGKGVYWPFVRQGGERNQKRKVLVVVAEGRGLGSRGDKALVDQE